MEQIEENFKKIANYLAYFCNWRYITSNDGRSITLWNHKPTYTWNGWENDYEKTPTTLQLLPEYFLGNLGLSYKMIFKREV